MEKNATSHDSLDGLTALTTSNEEFRVFLRSEFGLKERLRRKRERTQYIREEREIRFGQFLATKTMEEIAEIRRKQEEAMSQVGEGWRRRREFYNTLETVVWSEDPRLNLRVSNFVESFLDYGLIASLDDLSRLSDSDILAQYEVGRKTLRQIRERYPLSPEVD